MKSLVLILSSIIIFSGCSLNPFNYGQQAPEPTPSQKPTQEEVMGVKEELEIKTRQTLPADAEQTILRDVSGSNGSAIATRKFKNQFEITILADLPELQDNTFYEGWLVRGQPDNTDFDIRYLGKLLPSKGGWILEYTQTANMPEHKGIVVTEETQDDQKPETHILEGSF